MEQGKTEMLPEHSSPVTLIYQTTQGFHSGLYDGKWEINCLSYIIWILLVREPLIFPTAWNNLEDWTNYPQNLYEFSITLSSLSTRLLIPKLEALNFWALLQKKHTAITCSCLVYVYSFFMFQKIPLLQHFSFVYLEFCYLMMVKWMTETCSRK